MGGEVEADRFRLEGEPVHCLPVRKVGHAEFVHAAPRGVIGRARLLARSAGRHEQGLLSALPLLHRRERATQHKVGGVEGALAIRIGN